VTSAPEPTAVLVSFDIDGTLEIGDPPGPIGLDLVRLARERGYVIGTSSDRTVADQRRLWELAGLEADFVGHKHHLEATRARFDCDRLVHIGDTHVDEYYATLAGFEFWYAVDVPAPGTAGWIF
jgi:hypothetical protein